MLDILPEPDLGFIFYPHEAPEHPGHPRLDVIIPAKPTYRHFDPQKAQYQVASSTNDIEHITIHHPWTLGKTYRVCAGRVFLTDRKAKHVEAFSFGGDLQIMSETDQTVCALVSDAPIFPLFTTHDLPMWIVAEVEALLARQEAHWDPQHPHSFEMHLATVDPFLLYVACLQGLQDRVAHLPNGANELDHEGQHFVYAEIKRLQDNGAWPLLPPTLPQLFS